MNIRTGFLGMVRLRPGDVVQLGGGPVLVDRATESGAHVLPMDKKRVTVNPKLGDGPEEFFKFKDPFDISLYMPPETVLERRGQQGVIDFLAAKKASRRAGAVAVGAETNKETESETDMAKLKAKGGPRGGLAAEAAADKARESKMEAKAEKARLKAETKAAKKAAKAAAKKNRPAKNGTISYAGRAELVAKLIEEGKTDKQIMEDACTAYPGSTKSNVQKTIDAKRAKAKKAEKQEKEEAKATA